MPTLKNSSCTQIHPTYLKVELFKLELIASFLKFYELASELLHDKFLDSKSTTNKLLKGSLFKDPTCNK